MLPKIPIQIKRKSIDMSVSLPKANITHLLHQQELIHDPASELEITQFPGGFSNLTYRLAIEGKTFVLRRPPVGAIKRGHDMGREYRVLSHLSAVFDKVPKTFYYTADSDLIGAPFYLMEEVQGIILYDKTVRQSNIQAAEFARIADSWLNTFVELHQIDYRAAGLSDLGKPEGYVNRQVYNWSRQYLKAATDDIPEAHKVMSWMEEKQPTEAAHSLIHNDYKYNNVVFIDNSWQEIRAILDWEMCTLGDPLMDLGTSLGYWVTANDPDAFQQLANSPTVLPGNPTRTEIVQRYAGLSGLPIRHLTFYYVYGLFKIAVIVQQIYYRYQAGYTQDPRFAQLNKFTEALCRTAWRAIQRDRIE
jgi:aminoglycoside phosphotransferase (APT) family kinase protein